MVRVVGHYGQLFGLATVPGRVPDLYPALRGDVVTVRFGPS